MTQVFEAPALFDSRPDGSFALYGDPSVEDDEQIAKTDWFEGRSAYVSQQELATALVAPDCVDTAAYAAHLASALECISKANEDRGYKRATGSAVSRSRVEAHGGAATDEIADELEARGLEGMKHAREAFFAASGLGYLAVKRPLSGYEIIVRNTLEERWQAFLTAYGGTGPAAQEKRATRMANLAVYTKETVNA